MNKQTLFGTDGVRGTANSYPMDPETIMRLGMAAGSLFSKGDHKHRVVIGKDTRLSGYMVEPALTAGFIAVGMDVILVGPLPTPAVAMITRSLRADLGVMISASHNPYEDNGIKLFRPNGLKLTDETQAEIEALVQKDMSELRTSHNKLGRAKRLDDAAGRYIEYAKQTFPKGMRLDGLKIVIDCANGAAYKIAPTVLWELGAEVISIGVEPNGENINANCGATHPDAMAKAVKEYKADIGIALDGDADRIIISDEKGNIVDGDQIMAAIATHWNKQGTLKGGGVVSTVMANLGLEEYLKSQGLTLERTQVGDRYVLESMLENNYNLGGEPSGHIIFNDFITTGDGLIASLQVLAYIVQSKGKKVGELLSIFKPVPQVLYNVRYKNEEVLESPEVQDTIKDAEKQLHSKGRLLIRKSGTEPLIRIMAEAFDKKDADSAAKSVADAVQKAS